MKLDFIVVPRLSGLVLPCLMALTACSTGGSEPNQRYFTWVDEFGRVRQSPITEEKNPVEQRAAQVEAEKASSSSNSNDSKPGNAKEPHTVQDADVKTSSGVAAVEDENTRVSTERPPAQTPEIEVPIAADGMGHKVEAASEPPNVPVTESMAAGGKTASNDEPNVALETSNSSRNQTTAAQEQAVEPDQSLTTSPPPKSTPQQGQGNESEYTLENYPDGNELAEQGFIREGDPLPYYTWRDAQGNVRVDYYRPEGGFGQSRSDRPVPPLTSALVIDGSRQSKIEQANNEALAVLGIDHTETLLESWVRQCCQDLPKKDLAEWDDSREFQLDLDSLAPEFDFSTGSSVYRLVSLPKSENAPAFVMQVRSYVKQGVFLPTLAFLGGDMETRRLVTELAFEYHPESWHSHGYLEARVPVFPRQGDRWLLIMSRSEDQTGQTVFETEEGTTVIRHTGHGLMGLAQLDG